MFNARYFNPGYFNPRYFTAVGAAVTVPASLTLTVEALLNSAWVNLTADVHVAMGLHIAYGIEGNGPTDCVAGPGECTFSLNNSASTTRLLGTYSPFHANCRAGWTFGVPIRVTLTDPADGTAYIKHRGKVRVIDPTAGLKGERLVHVVSYDAMYDLMETDARSLGIATGQTEFDLIAAVLDSLPSDAQPVARNLDTGLDVFAYAFHDIGGGVKALGLIKDIAVDAYAFVVMRGDGTFLARNRHTRGEGTTTGAFTDATLQGFTAPSSLEQATNLVRVTITPPTIDPSPTSVLYADQAVRSIGAGQTSEFWVTYSDPETATATLIGGLDVVTPLVGTDYAGNTQADGLGSDASTDLVVTMTDFGSSALMSVANIGAATVHLVNGLGAPFLQMRGRGVYLKGSQTYEASSMQAYGVRPTTIDLRYQDDPQVAQSYADFVEAQRHSLMDQPQTVAFTVQGVSAQMTHALAREPGDVITVTETMTGYSDVNAVIHGIDLTILPKGTVAWRARLAPVAPFEAWRLGVTGHTELGQTTVLGF
jgi:hypothetical protein